VPFILLIAIVTKNSRKGWWIFTREEFPARGLSRIAKILQQKIFDAADACLMTCLCIAISVRFEIVREKEGMPDVIDVTNFPASILKIFP
jgi:hypothetical protein